MNSFQTSPFASWVLRKMSDRQEGHPVAQSPAWLERQRVDTALSEARGQALALRAELSQRDAELRSLLESKTVRFARLLQAARHEPWRIPLLPVYAGALLLPAALRRRGRSALARVKNIVAPRRVRTVERDAWPADRPLLSVIIPCYNYGAFVAEAVDSVLAQTFRDLEILVVDGGSGEPTLEVLRRLERPQTTVLFREGRHLVGDNRNFGIERARGKWICCLDADDLLHPTYLEKAVFVAEAGGWDVVYPAVRTFGASSRTFPAPDTTFERCLVENGIPTVAIFLREAWQTVGGYRDWGLGEDYVYEDWDFWARLLGHGFRAKSLLEPLMHYRVHTKGLSSATRKTIAEHRNTIREANGGLRTRPDLRRRRALAAQDVRVLSPRRNLDRAVPAAGPHVLFAVPFTVIGGADTILTQIAHALRADGFRVSVVSTLEPLSSMGDGTAAWERVTRDVFHLPRFLPDGPLRREFFLHLLESRRTSVLLVAGSELAYELLPEIKSSFPDLRVVDQQFNEFGHLGRNRAARAWIDLHLVATRVLERLLVAEHGEDPGKVRTILHGVDAAHGFHPDEVTPLSLGQLGPGFEERKIVAFVGRLSEEKDPLLFVDVAERLRERDDVAFLMVGDGPLAGAVRARAASAGLRESFLLTSFVDDVRPLLRTADVLLLPSRIEGIPIVLLETQSLRVPVVASRVGGIPDVVQDGENGLLCEPGNVDAFVERLEWLLDHDVERARMGTNARARVEERFDLARTSRDYVEALRSLLGLTR